MSRRSRLVIALLAVVSMSGGATSGVYLGRLDDGRKVATTRPPPTRPLPRYWIQPQAGGDQGAPQPGGAAAPPGDAAGRGSTRAPGQPAPPTSAGLAFMTETTVLPSTPTTVPGTTAKTTASPGATTSTTGPLVLTARIDARLPDGLLIRLDASEPLRRVVLRWGAGKTLAHTTPVQGPVTHGSVKLPLSGKAVVTVAASGTTADGRTVTSNQVRGQPR